MFRTQWTLEKRLVWDRQDDSSVSMDDVLESGSLAPEEDEAGCLFCVDVRSGLLVLRHGNNPG